ncbi:gluconate 2-dehydrogenase subunit 3 family protein [Sessilibacter sp. MAH4]
MNNNNNVKSSDPNATSNNTASNNPTSLSRRQFLNKAGITTVGIGLASSGLFSANTWAAKAVGKKASATLHRMARDIYPHDELDDKYYSQVMLPLADKADNDPQLKEKLLEGVNTLDQLSQKYFGKDFVDIKSEADRVKVLRAIENSGFFQTIKGNLMMGIYNNPELWQHFGYGGSAWEQGGYIRRGYNDIDWL